MFLRGGNVLRTVLVDGVGSRWAPAFALDLHALALFRIGLGFLLVWDLGTRLVDFETHYTESGILPLEATVGYSDAPALLPLHKFSPSGWWQRGLFVGALVASAGMLLGIRARSCCFIGWLLLAAVHARNPLVLYGADQLLIVVLFWGMFLPLGARWGVDAWRAGRRGAGRVMTAAGIGLVWQVSVVYFFSFLSKTGPSWGQGEALEMVLRLEYYTSDWGRWLQGRPGWLPLLTRATLWIESVAPLMLLVPHRGVRWGALALLGGLQVGFAIFLEVGLFPYISILALLPLLPRVIQCRRHPVRGEVRLNRAGEWGAGLSAIAMVLWNIGVSQVQFEKNRLKSMLPSPLVWGLERFHLDQSWSMFSPDPPSDTSLLMIKGTLGTGEEINVLRPGEPISWRRPNRPAASLGGDRWRAYLLNLRQRGLTWRPVCQFWMERWGREFPEAAAIEQVEVFSFQIAGPSGRPRELVRVFHERAQP